MSVEEPGGDTAAKVQEAAATVQQVTKRRRRITGGEAERVARRYFQALDEHDLEEAVALWAEGGRENVRGQVDVTAPDGVRAFVSELFEAVPDVRFEIASTTAQGDRCAVQWKLRGTFAGPGSLAGIEPTGHPITMEGIDLLTVKDAHIESNDAFPDSIALPRQIGMMPPSGSAADQRLTGAFNKKTRLTARLGAGDAELVAEGVW